MIESFLNAHRYSVNTRDRYSRALKLFLVDFPEGGRELSASDLLKWLEREGWGSNQQSICLYAIRGFLRHHFGASHPALQLRLKRIPSAPRKALTVAELDILLSSFDTTTPKGVRDLAICGVFLDCALRVAEVARLELEYVFLDDRLLTVIVKGGEWGFRAFSNYTAVWLADWLAVRETVARAGEKKVFVAIGGNYPGRGLTTDGLKMIVRGWRESTGIEKLHPHLFRHSFATLITRNGAPVNVGMIGGGWKSEKVYRGYTQDLCLDDVRRYLPVGRQMGEDP
jgi:site-specific recombinase XerD